MDEADKIRKELLDLHLVYENGIEIGRVTLPNPDGSKYEEIALKIKRIMKRLEDTSYDTLEDFCHKRNLKISRTIEKGYWIIYTPKKQQQKTN